MRNHDELPELATSDLDTVVGGAGADLSSIRAKAQQHCPQTAARYAHVNPASVTRPQAEKMGAACLAEMGPFKASFARPVIENAIDQAFPRK
jgi:hypothetical protein